MIIGIVIFKQRFQSLNSVQCSFFVIIFMHYLLTIFFKFCLHHFMYHFSVKKRRKLTILLSDFNNLICFFIGRAREHSLSSYVMGSLVTITSPTKFSLSEYEQICQMSISIPSTSL